LIEPQDSLVDAERSRRDGCLWSSLNGGIATTSAAVATSPQSSRPR
jgi:hypothetical protein